MCVNFLQLLIVKFFYIVESNPQPFFEYKVSLQWPVSYLVGTVVVETKQTASYPRQVNTLLIIVVVVVGLAKQAPQVELHCNNHAFITTYT